MLSRSIASCVEARAGERRPCPAALQCGQSVRALHRQVLRLDGSEREAAGRVAVRKAPPDGPFAAVRSPPCARRMRRAMASPRPAPGTSSLSVRLHRDERTLSRFSPLTSAGDGREFVA